MIPVSPASSASVWDSTSLRPRKPPFAVTSTALSRGDSNLAKARHEKQSPENRQLHGCAELSAQPLIHPHSCRLRMKRGGSCICFGSNEAAGQIARLFWREHRFRSFPIRYAFTLIVEHPSRVTIMAIVSEVKIPTGIIILNLEPCGPKVLETSGAR